MTRSLVAAVIAFICFTTAAGNLFAGKPTVQHRIADGTRAPLLVGSVGSPGVLSASALDTTYFGGTVWAADSSRWEAIQGSCWTFDTGVGSHFDHNAPHVNPFKDPSLHASMEGWVGIDNSFSTGEAYFRRLTAGDFPGTVCVGASAGLGGAASLFAGVLPAEANDLCYAGGQGYGDNWRVSIEKSYPSYPGGDITLSYNYTSETEPGFDYTSCSVDTSGNGDLVEVNVFTGTASGVGGAVLSQGTNLPHTLGGTIKIVFRAESDGAYSDQDGLYPTTCGAFAIDDVSLTGAVSDFSDFESGDQGWQLAPQDPGQGGDWSNLVHIADLPAPLSPCDCGLSDSVLVFEDFSAGGHNNFQDNIAVSPWIDLKEAGLVGTQGKFIEANVYADLPLLNYVFVQYNVQWYPQVCPNSGNLGTSPFTSNGFVYYFGGTPNCLTDRVEFGSVVSQGAEQVRIALGVISYCRFFAGCSGVTNSTPWFDNVKFGVYGNAAGPFLSARGIDLPFDSFPQNGTLRLTAPARVDCNTVKGDSQPEIGTSLGDTLTVRTNSGQNLSEVFIQFCAKPGPYVPQPQFNDWLTGHQPENVWEQGMWYSARIDTAEVGGVVVEPSLWMATYHEADPNFQGLDTDSDFADLDPNGAPRLLNDIFPEGSAGIFTPGTRINMFYKARYVDATGVPTTGVWTTFPDTSGGNYLEMEVLPSSAASDSTWNCVLFVDHADGGPEQKIFEDALGAVLPGPSANFECVAWDRWEIYLPFRRRPCCLHDERGGLGAIGSESLKHPSWRFTNLQHGA